MDLAQYFKILITMDHASLSFLQKNSLLFTVICTMYCRSNIDKPMLDFIFVVENSEDWHSCNMKRNPSHYSSIFSLSSQHVAIVQVSLKYLATVSLHNNPVLLGLFTSQFLVQRIR